MKKKNFNSKSIPQKKIEKNVFSFDKYISYFFVFLIAIIAVIYYRTLSYSFIVNWDDAGYILNNPYIKEFSLRSFADIFSNFYLYNYHPITTLTYSIEYAIVGENPGLFHFNNILLHSVNTYLVYLLSIKIFNKHKLASFIVAALFALHPMHVESVAWISQRKDLMYAMFYILALLNYCKYLETKEFKFFIYTAVLFLFSCLSKSAAVTLPILLFAFDFYFKRKFSFKLILEKIPLVLVSLLFGVLAIKSQDTAIRDLTPMLSIFERLLIVNYSLMTYIVKSVFAINLSAFYPYPIKLGGQLPIIYFLAPILSLIFAFLVFKSYKKTRVVLFGLMFFLITISLVVQLLPVGGAIIAERYTYIPYLGLFFILVSPLIKELYAFTIKQSFQRVYTISLVLLLVVFSFQSYNRVAVWQNGEILFTDVIEKYPNFPYAYNNRGSLYVNEFAEKKFVDNPRLKETYQLKAYEDFSRAIMLYPTYEGALMNRAVLAFNMGKPNEAIRDFDKVLEINPYKEEALLGRANSLSSLRKFNEALLDYDLYISLKNDNAEAYLYRAIALTRINKAEVALSDFQKSIELNSENWEAYYWLGIIDYQLRSVYSSLQNFNKAIELNSKNGEIYSWRGLVHFELNKIKEAIDDFSMAIKINPNDFAAYVNRSLAFDKIMMYKEALADLDYVKSKNFFVNQAYYESLKRKARQ